MNRKFSSCDISLRHFSWTLQMWYCHYWLLVEHEFTCAGSVSLQRESVSVYSTSSVIMKFGIYVAMRVFCCAALMSACTERQCMSQASVFVFLLAFHNLFAIICCLMSLYGTWFCWLLANVWSMFVDIVGSRMLSVREQVGSKVKWYIFVFVCLVHLNSVMLSNAVTSST